MAAKKKPGDKFIPVIVRMHPDTHGRLVDAAEALGVSHGEVVRRALADLFSQLKPTRTKAR